MQINEELIRRVIEEVLGEVMGSGKADTSAPVQVESSNQGTKIRFVPVATQIGRASCRERV